MGNGMNKILPGLYIGNFRDPYFVQENVFLVRRNTKDKCITNSSVATTAIEAVQYITKLFKTDSKDKQQLTENKITHIVSAHDNAKALLQGYRYHCINVADSVGQDLTPYFKDCIIFIHRARSEGGNVLVHCIAGISRSTTLAAAYIMAVTEMDWTEILTSIKCSRSIANPNSAFKRQLYEFGRSEEIKLLKRNITRQFPSTSFRDEEFLREVVENTSKNEPKLLQEYEDGINTLAKYANSDKMESNRNAQVYCPETDDTEDDQAQTVEEG